MSTVTEKKSHQFQAEVSQLLKLMIHSLYSNKEIFLRELISNASDACDKLRFEALNNDALLKGDPELKIRVNFDKEAQTVSVTDNGIGMSYDDVMANIGTIARSGTKEFLQTLTGDQAKDANLIGQFGVGFYSSFIVADKVTVKTRYAGAAEDEAVQWESSGDGEYTIENITRAERGTEVILHLREGEDEFLSNWRLKSIITKYSDHISLPIMLPVEAIPESEQADKDGEDKTSEAKDKDKEETVAAEEQVNSATALWTRAKKDISEEEYKEFYKTISHDFNEPMVWSHNRVEGKQEYTSLLFIPKQAPFDLWDREHAHGIKLYVQRVFIMDESDQLMPKYLRFVRGLVDSNDLPLNVSREILQKNKIIDGIRSGSVKKILGLLENMAEKEPGQYRQFWQNFGNVLKEGPAEDFANKEQVAGLFRFASTYEDSSEQTVSLKDYIDRMKEDQEKIYYITADSYNAAKNSPHLEVFKQRGIEVLLLCDRVDEWMMQYLREYDGKSLASVAKGDIDFGGKNDDEKDDQGTAKETLDLIERLKKQLEDKVSEVKVSKRLTDSPVCIVLGEHEMAMYMQKLMQQAGHDMPSNKPVLEINPEHALIQKIDAEKETERFADWADVLFNQALLAEGGQLEDPAGFMKKLNTLMLG